MPPRLTQGNHELVEVVYSKTTTVWRESMEMTDELKHLLIETAKQLKGSALRLFQARTVNALGPGGASFAD
jgi:hypothetical protein